MIQESMSPYAVHFPKNALNHEVSFLAILKQFFYPTVRQESFCFNTTGFKSVFESIKNAYNYQVSKERIDSVRKATGGEEMDMVDYGIWLDSKSINLVVHDEAPGRAKIVVNLGGYGTEANMKAPGIGDIEETIIGTFYMSTMLKENACMVLFGAEGYDLEALAELSVVPFSFTPVINFSFRAKNQNDQKDIVQLLQELDEAVHKEAFWRVMWNMGATDESKTELIPFVDFETVKEEIMTVFNNWKDWNGGYDSPMSFSYSANVVPKINTEKSTPGNARVVYEWRHVVELASTKTFLIPLETVEMT